MSLFDALAAVPDPVWSWGPAAFVLLGVYALTVRALKALNAVAAAGLTRFLATQEKQAEAMSRLAVCVEDGRRQDNLEYKEILLDLRILGREVRDISKRVREIQEGERHVA